MKISFLKWIRDIHRDHSSFYNYLYEEIGLDFSRQKFFRQQVNPHLKRNLGAGGLYYKTYYGRNLRILVIS
jgi:hypothetical protein